MRPLLMGAVGIFIVGTLFACIASGRWLLNGEINIINALASLYEGISENLRTLQSGRIRTYATFFTLGVAILIAYVVLV